jgi:hypothetical protein
MHARQMPGQGYFGEQESSATQAIAGRFPDAMWSVSMERLYLNLLFGGDVKKFWNSPIRKELVIVLAVKLIVLAGLWFAFFRSPADKQLTPSDVSRVLIGNAPSHQESTTKE